MIMRATDLLPGRSFYINVLAIALLVAACGGGGSDTAPANPTGISLRLERIDSASLVFSFPLLLTAPPGDMTRLFVVEKGGRIKVVDKSTNSLIGTGTFLNITGLVSTGGEQGLLGVTFDPNYATNRRFYVSYTDTSGNSVIARYLVSTGNANVAVSAADRMILTLAQPFSNHNGGMIAFGPDGMLYIGFGDGGDAGDPGNRAQNKAELLGKLLRIDVSQSTSPQPAYTIPSDNPFVVGPAGARQEIWSLGLRNPWRYSFDRQTADLYIADVGQGNWEEVDVSTSASGGGRGTNYGWNVMEGNHCFSPSAGCDMTGLTLPLLEYGHGNGCSITGGYAYRGVAIPGLEGTYFYGDFCAGFVRSFRLVNGTATQVFDWTALRPGGNITSFGEDGSGELYIMTSSGALYRIAQG
jgi:glucose/arabinose dehydrogenase